MPTPHIRLTLEANIATISLCNPARHNALSAENVALFVDLLKQVENNPDVRVLIITNPDGKTFCAGAALNEIASGKLTSNQFAALPEKIASLKFPTIAAINGSAFGGGAEIALSCDFRIGVSHMKLHVPPARIGLCYPISGIQRFVNLLGISTAKRLLIANEEFSGGDLYRLGFLTHLVEKDQIHATAQTMAARITQLAPLAMATMKRLCDDIGSANVDRDKFLHMESLCNQSDDLKEGLSAIIEKRTAVFTGQ